MTEKELMEMVVDELTEYRLSQHRKENSAEYAALTAELTQLDKAWRAVLENMEPQSARVIEEYHAKSMMLADKDCMFLYVQGAKDCVSILKRLGAF